MSEEDVLQVVKERLTDDVESVRSAAVISLRKVSPDSITGDIVSVIKDRLADSSNNVRVSTVITFINLPSLITADVFSALLDRLKFDQRTGTPVEDIDDTRARVIEALSRYDDPKEEDLLLLMQNLRPQLRNKDGKFVHYPQSQEATYTLLMEMLHHPAFTAKVVAELDKIVKESPAFKLLAYMTAGSKESVYNMKLKEPNGQILMHFHGGGGWI
jgi:phage pi2 protein 07